GLTPDKIMTPAAFENALRMLLAIGGSTNGLVHLAAIAGRLGIEIDLEAFDRLGEETPVLVDLKPSGQHYMEDLFRAGGAAPILRALAPMLRLDALTISGRSLGAEIDAAPADWGQTVVRGLDDPIYPKGGIAVLRGNLAPGGAIIKQSAAQQDLLVHEGRAVVFDSLEDMALRLDDPDLDVKPDDVLVLRNAGPKGAPGMPEAGYIPIPRKLASRGVKDMVRISDARMSGTAFGTIVLHISPEAAIGGPLALVRDGDRIALDVPGRRLELLVGEEELRRRRSEWNPLEHAGSDRGYLKLYLDHVTQAERGCDFDFLEKPQRIARTPLPTE